MTKYKFSVGADYQRRAVKEQVGAGLATDKGGNWDTGLASHNGAHFIFCNIGVPGRTGDDYDNRWDGDELEWSGANRSRLTHDRIKAIISPGAEVHIFYRNDDRDPFTYAGLGHALDSSGDQPVRVRWRLGAPNQAPLGPLTGASQALLEGAKKTREVTRVERNPKARRECLDHYGAKCAVCEIVFAERYGQIGDGYMHVHHLSLVSELAEEAAVDPVKDLRPVCPNCHSMLHRRKPPYTLEELRALLK
jgi:5-methylcytosine-specific restriction enzyme A